MSWQLQEAKQKFSELVRRTLEEGPQVVTRHGEEVVVVVPAEEFRRMNGEREAGLQGVPDECAGAERIIRTSRKSCRGTSSCSVKSLLNTNVLSEVRRPRGDANVKLLDRTYGSD